MSDAVWTTVLPADDLRDRRPSRIDLEGTPVLLYRDGERLFAIGARCTHQGAPLDRGPVRVAGSEVTVTCPAHGSIFRLTDGSVARAPATQPEPVFDARIEDGSVQLRPRA
jgi:nitrite reductase/ring-hydroxylating ferredoxin subunit